MTWDYDKLFEIGNIIILNNEQVNTVESGAFFNTWFWKENYGNEKLEYNMEKSTHIEMIIRPDYANRKADIIFNRKTDTNFMPKLETGMFINTVVDNDNCLGIICNDKIVFQDGDYDSAQGSFDENGDSYFGENYYINKVWKTGSGFNTLKDENIIWER